MRVYQETYGCTLNFGEGELLKKIAENEGHEIVGTIENADLLLLSTCTVIKSTEEKMLSRLRYFLSKNKPIIVSGCMASAQVDLIKKYAPESFLIPPSSIQEFSSLLRKFDYGKRNKNAISSSQRKIEAIIPISNGCISKCAYCIARIARGKLISYPIDLLKKRVLKSLEEGAKEIRLTALDTASYGMDIGKNLYELILEINKIEFDGRIRIGMMNPAKAIKILPLLLKIYKFEKVYKFIHLPVQSGDNSILEKMERGYNSEDFCKIVSTLRSEIKNITLSTDVIVGFPCEGENEFDSTVKLIEKIKPDILNIKGFSPREGTKGYKLWKAMPVKQNIIKERTRFLSSMQIGISRKNNEKFVGTEQEVLFTELGEKGGIKGRTNNYKVVVVENRKDLLGKFANVKITEARNFYLVGVAK
ncbi:MAG: tRNA (N(6)-L-threonylcarbamoyladenosine(37)-C(2))-methylthiotransferase [Candidatus Thermoplasmatota archaeon]